MTKTIHKIEDNSQIDYFNSLPNKKRKKEENKVFDLILVDIVNLRRGNISCVKKNMYNPELKYICISYRWGELNEQHLVTPGFTAHITSFDLRDLEALCEYIKYEPDLKNIDYLWIDAISVDQQNKERKKDTILKMNQIYQHATYILAVPDLHLRYLLKHPANMEIVKLMYIKYNEIIYKEIFNNEHPATSNDINSSISTNSTLLCDSTSEQLINNNDEYSSIQKSAIEILLKKMEEIENKDLEIEIKELIKKMKKNEKELKKENKELKIEMKEKEIENKNKKIEEEKRIIYNFLAYLIEDWSNRAWVISEYQIAKDKYKKNGTPLKYIFISLWNYKIKKQYFFSYHFNNDQQSTINNNELSYQKVNDYILFNQFVKSRFMQRSHLEMILNSNVKNNEDRFNAILPSWNKHSHLIKNVSDWNITDMTSVRLKLYEIMDDLWDKATLLHTCKEVNILPTFASDYQTYYLKIIEKVDYNNDVYKQYEESLLRYLNSRSEQEAIKIQQLMDEYKMNSKSIWNESLTSIQFDKHHCYLSVKSKIYFIRKAFKFEAKKHRNKLSLDDDDELHEVFIPFFTSNLPGYIDKPYIYNFGSRICLIGNKKKNKWILFGFLSDFKSEHFCTDDYTFNIY